MCEYCERNLYEKKSEYMTENIVASVFYKVKIKFCPMCGQPIKEKENDR